MSEKHKILYDKFSCAPKIGELKLKIAIANAPPGGTAALQVRNAY
jgi:hypothetical protein